MKKTIVHIAPHDRNIGDNALNLAIDRMLGDRYSLKHMELVGNPFDEEAFNTLNSANAVIFGGGGVIHSCSGGNSRKNREKTGTMWNMDLEKIAKLNSKIILYSVGFNKFDGEPAPLKRMGEFFNLLNEKKSLVSFRNDGSKERFLQYFPQFEGIQVKPDPGLFCRGVSRTINEPYVLVQIATDRLDYRYPFGFELFLELINTLCALTPFKVVLLPHTQSDAKLYERHRKLLNVDYVSEAHLKMAHTDLAMELYRNAEYTISTRGHSQICSIGNSTPTFCLSTHPKAVGFMADIGQLDACSNYHTDSVEECILKFEFFQNSLSERKKHLIELNKRFDGEIIEFNNEIVNFVENGHIPAPILVNTAAKAELEPAILKPEFIEVDKVGTREEYAILPGSSIKVPAGTYFAGNKFSQAFENGASKNSVKESRSVKKVVSNFFSRSLTLKREYRTLDGLSCGVVVSCDANYFEGVEPCINAFRRYNPKIPVTFLDAGLNSDQVETAKNLTDSYCDLVQLKNLNLATFPSHLSKAALSSLYLAEASYDKILYLDVDALVLDSLEPMFEALTVDCDIVGIRGNLFGYLNNGVRHVARNEITQAGQKILEKIYPQANLDAPGINTGCFATRKEVAKSWMPLARELFGYMQEFRTADQALLNVMMPILGLRLRLFDRMYNCMGFQLSEKRHIVQSARASIAVSEDACELFLGSSKIKVAHFAGRLKPWKKSDYSELSVAWDWHAAKTKTDRNRLLEKYRVSKSVTEAESETLVDQQKSQKKQFIPNQIEIGRILRRKGHYVAAFRMFEHVLSNKANSLASQRAIVDIGPRIGRTVFASELIKKNKKFISSKDKLLSTKTNLIEFAVSGKYKSINDLEDTERFIRKIRSLFIKGKQDLAQEEISLLSHTAQLVPEIFALRSHKRGLDTITSLTKIWCRILSDNAALRKGENTSFRKANARLTGVGSWIRKYAVKGGRVAQVGPGYGSFLIGVSTITSSIPVAIGGMEDANHSISKTEIVDVASDTDIKPVEAFEGIILADILDRTSDINTLIDKSSQSLKKNGFLLLVESLHREPQWDCLEGFRMFPPCSELKSLKSMREILQSSKLDFKGCWIIGDERIILASCAVDEKKSELPILFDPELINLVRLKSEGYIDATNNEEISSEKGKILTDPFFNLLGGAVETSEEPGKSLGVLQEAEGNASISLPMPKYANKEKNKSNIYHIGFWNSHNAGDKALLESTSKLIRSLDDNPQFIRKNLSEKAVPSVSSAFPDALFLLVGGGGLFVQGGVGDGVWQWNISYQEIMTLDIPIVVFGVGLNDFSDGELYRTEIFCKVWEALAEKAIFIGLRERQSCEIIRSIIPEKYRHKVVFQPCPTTLLSTDFSALNLPNLENGKSSFTVGINVAFDRSQFRFKHSLVSFVQKMNAVVDALLERDHVVKLIGHNAEDMYLGSVLQSRRKIELVDISKASLEKVALAYDQCDMAIGMRTHAQLVPFGLNKPIVSLLSHQKMNWMIDDLSMCEKSVEIGDPLLVQKIVSITETIRANYQSEVASIRNKQMELLDITTANLDNLKTQLRSLEIQ